MKRLLILPVILVTVLLYSCNNGPAKEETKTADTTAVADSTAQTKVVPAFVPFKVVIVQHRVKDLAKSETEYFNRDSLRNTYGITHYVIGRDLKDSNTVFVVDKIEDLEKAKAFYALPGAKEAMKRAGVSSPPGFTYAEIVRNSESAVQFTNGVAVSHHVKDFNAWLKAYDAEGVDARRANGLVDRAIVRNLYDSNSISILFEVSDMTKAKARMASPELKKIMTDAGVDSPPTIRWYQLLK